jgi:ribose transport system permease protein
MAEPDPTASAQSKQLAETDVLAEAELGSRRVGDFSGLGLLRRAGQLLGPFGAVIAIVIYLTFATQYFWTSDNIRAIFVQMAVIAIIAVGETMVIITAGIDLSVSTVVALSGTMAAYFIVQNSFSVPLGFVAGILIGGLVGLLNGILVTRLLLPPFIATLGTLSVAGGVALLVTNGEAVYGLPSSFTDLGTTSLGPIPWPVVVMIVVAVVAYFIMAHTTLGRSAYAIGSNPETARLSGINIGLTLLLIYVIQGLLAGLGGVIDASRLGIGPPLGGQNYNLQAIAAAVIGGASLFGGEGNIIGALIGALLIELIANGSDLLNISTFWQQVILGIVIVLAVLYDQVRRRALAGR